MATNQPALARYRWAGYASLLDQRVHPWQSITRVLTRLAPAARPARALCRAFVAENLPGAGALRSQAPACSGAPAAARRWRRVAAAAITERAPYPQAHLHTR